MGKNCITMLHLFCILSYDVRTICKIREVGSEVGREREREGGMSAEELSRRVGVGVGGRWNVRIPNNKTMNVLASISFKVKL